MDEIDSFGLRRNESSAKKLSKRYAYENRSLSLSRSSSDLLLTNWSACQCSAVCDKMPSRADVMIKGSGENIRLIRDFLSLMIVWTFRWCFSSHCTESNVWRVVSKMEQMIYRADSVTDRVNRDSKVELPSSWAMNSWRSRSLFLLETRATKRTIYKSISWSCANANVISRRRQKATTFISVWFEGENTDQNKCSDQENGFGFHFHLQGN